MQKRHWKQLVKEYASLHEQWVRTKSATKRAQLRAELSGFASAASIMMGTSFGTFKVWAAYDSNGELSKQQLMYNVGKFMSAADELRKKNI